MILLDTHIWIWWVHGSPQLLADYRTRSTRMRRRASASAPFPVGRWQSWWREAASLCPCPWANG